MTGSLRPIDVVGVLALCGLAYLMTMGIIYGSRALWRLLLGHGPRAAVLAARAVVGSLLLALCVVAALAAA